MAWRGYFWGSLFVLGLASSSAQAEALPFPPKQGQICVAGGSGKIVDKDKVANYLLRKYPFNAIAVRPTSDPALARLNVARRILADGKICDGNDLCSSSDKQNREDAVGFMTGVLAGLSTGLTPTRPVDAELYFTGSNQDNAIVCKEQNGNPVEAPGAVFDTPPKSSSPFRVHGKVTDLYIDRSAQKEFQASSPATFNFSSDGIAKKKSETFQGVLGYAIPTTFLSENGQRLVLIPYAQANRSIVKTGTGVKAKKNASETVDVGLTGNVFMITPNDSTPIGHVINIRPDYLWDRRKHYEIASLNFQYLPVINGRLNDFIVVGSDFASFKPIFDVRFDVGTFRHRNNIPANQQHQDYSRLGGQVGLAVVSDYPDLPLSFTTTYTRLLDLAGGIDVHYWANALTFSFGANKYFGITLGYSRGVREDTTKHERLWNLGFSAKY